MKKVFTKKMCALLLCCCMAGSSMSGLAACTGDETTKDDGSQNALPEVTYQQYDYSEDDSKFALSLSSIATFVTGKIVDKAKSTAMDFISDIGNKIWTKATDWLKNSLLYCLGIEPTPVEPQYTINDVYEQVTTINSEIKALKDEVEQLQQQTTTGHYVDKYNAFMSIYNAVVGTIEVPVTALEQINIMRSDDFAEDSQVHSDYEAAAGSLEGNIRGSGNMATPINQQTDLSRSVINLGKSMIGDSGITDVDKDGIFSVIRYFSELQTPWQHQRKAIEDNYLATLIYTYQLAHSLVLFDLTYQMQKYDIGGVYTAADDGTVLAFQYPAEGGQWYYNAYPYAEASLRNEYSKEFDSFEEDGSPVTIHSLTPEMTGVGGNYSDLYYLFGYYAQHVSQYNTIMVKFNNYTREDIEGQLVLQKAIKSDGTYDEQSFPKSLTGMVSQDFISLNADDEFYIDFDKFNNCTKSEFLNFINIIKPYASEKSLYEYLSCVGFEIPRSGSGAYKNYFVLGVQKLNDFSRVDNYQHIRPFLLYSIDMDAKVKDIGDDSFFTCLWCTGAKWSGVCNDKKSYTHRAEYYEGTTYYRMPSLTVRAQYSCDITKWASKGGYPSYPYFVSIPGLSKDSLSGTVGRGNLNTSW